jgi:hypothetical protein
VFHELCTLGSAWVALVLIVTHYAPLHLAPPAANSADSAAPVSLEPDDAPGLGRRIDATSRPPSLFTREAPRSVARLAIDRTDSVNMLNEH